VLLPGREQSPRAAPLPRASAQPFHAAQASAGAV